MSSAGAKVMLITGASRGIGAATARLAARHGYDVAVNYASNKAAAEAVVADIRKAGRKAVAIQADVGKPEDIVRLFKTVDAELGRLDAFFNNAGIVEKASKFVDIAPERLERILAINTVGAFIAAQEAVRRMSTRLGGKGGAIVNMSSMAAKLGGSNESTDYATAKGAIDSLTIGLAKELAGEGIRVNAVRPGLIDTDIQKDFGVGDRVGKNKHLVPLQRGGTAEEVAEAVLWLCSERASYCTGLLLDVAGGRGTLLDCVALPLSPMPEEHGERELQVAYSCRRFACSQPGSSVGQAVAHCRALPDRRQTLAVGGRADVRVPRGPILPSGRPRPPVRDRSRRHRQIDAAHLPQRPHRRRDGRAGTDRACRGQRWRPDHPFLLRLPAAADPARRHPPQPQRPSHAPAEVSGRRRGVDGALGPDVGHRPIAARQSRAAARALRRAAAWRCSATCTSCPR